MSGSARLFGHPIHQMLIVFPLGLLGTAAIFDVLYLVWGGNWSLAGWYMIAAGIIGGLLAAVFGLIDWLAIRPGTRAKRIGLLHAVGNVVVLVLFAVGWLMQRGAPAAPSVGALIPGFVGLMLAGVTGWLGGELVDRLGVGVDRGAHDDAPSSLKGPVITPAG